MVLNISNGRNPRIDQVNSNQLEQQKEKNMKDINLSLDNKECVEFAGDNEIRRQGLWPEGVESSASSSTTSPLPRLRRKVMGFVL